MKHLMIDAYSISPALLADRNVLLATLNEIPDTIGMRKAAKPFIEHIVTSNALDDGYSGYVIIYTSHISLHAWPPYGMLNMDVFSCNGFETETVLAYLQAHFCATRENIEIHEVERAMRSPREAMLAHDTTLSAPLV